MTQTEPQNTSRDTALESSGEGVFSLQTKKEALRILTERYGSLAGAMTSPVRNVLDWVLNNRINPVDYSRAIDARTRFNQAANDATHQQIEEKKAA